MFTFNKIVMETNSINKKARNYVLENKCSHAQVVLLVEKNTVFHEGDCLWIRSKSKAEEK